MKLLNTFKNDQGKFFVVQTAGGVSVLDEKEYRRVWGCYNPGFFKKKIAA